MSLLSIVPLFILRRCASDAILGVSASLDVDPDTWGVFPDPDGSKVIAHNGERISVRVDADGIELMIRGRECSYSLTPFDREVLRRSALRFTSAHSVVERRVMA